jgi:hypothetical protein
VRVTNWKKAGALSHPGLVAILASGSSTLEEMRCAYLVMERTEENPGEVLAERYLTADEAREMLLAVMGTLRHLHGRGFARWETS